MDKGLEFKRKHVLIDNTGTRYGAGLGGRPFSQKSEKRMNLAKFREQFQMQIQQNDPETLVVDIIGIDASIANALRRILIAEVPSVAINRVYIKNNTSIMQDEVLAHRLGLLPLLVDPKMLKDPPPREEILNVAIDEIPAPDPEVHLVFELQVTCKKNSYGKLEHQTVYSRDFKWIPIGDQKNLFKSNPPKMVHPDIPIMQLALNQTLDLVVHCTTGIGRDHTKWSPVATATYRILPSITFKKQLNDQQAEILVKKCPMGVFEIEELGSAKQVVAKYPRNCTICRECIREPGWEDLLQVARVRDHFIFSIESTGSIPASEIFKESLRILKNKCDTVKSSLEDLVQM